jgi:hypothetical protein
MVNEAMYGSAEVRGRNADAVNGWRARNSQRGLGFDLENIIQIWRMAMRKGVGTSLLVPFLFLDKITRDGEVIPFGLASVRMLTTAGVNFMVDAFQNLTEPENMKFHALGTGAAAEATGDTALGAEWAAGDYTGGVRATGNLTEGASANIFHTEATNTKASAGSLNVTEHGVFTQAALAGGTLLDRSVFAAVPVAQGEGILSKYELTINAGG